MLIANRLKRFDRPQTPHSLSEFTLSTPTWQGTLELFFHRSGMKRGSENQKWVARSLNRMSLKRRIETKSPEALASSSGPHASPSRLSTPHCVALPLSPGSTTEQIKTTPVRSGFAVTAPEGKVRVRPQEPPKNPFAFFFFILQEQWGHGSVTHSQDKKDGWLPNKFPGQDCYTQKLPTLADNPSQRWKMRCL